MKRIFGVARKETDMNSYKISFWNYLGLDAPERETAVKDWKDAGINLAMSFDYNPELHQKAVMLKLLDDCEKEGIKVIVRDVRTSYHRYGKIGEKEFRKGVKEAVDDFGNHPAVYGFHVGDEPDVNAWEWAIAAHRIVLEAAPALTPFLNMFPYWSGPSFEKLLGCDADGYTEKLIDFVRRSGAKVLSFDSYGQCAYFEREYYQECHILNFHIFRRAAEATGAQLFVSLLSVGHWGYRVPDDDDFRWQIYTAAAHGATGFFWFSFYQGSNLDGNYRDNPINMFRERTLTYQRLAYQDKVFLKFFAPLLSRCKYEKTEYSSRNYGGYPAFGERDELKRIETVVNETLVAVTRWIKDDGKPAYTFVNMDRKNPTKIRLIFEGPLAAKNCDVWIVPGQMVYVDEDKTV